MMRIAIANSSRREAGGAERYLASILPDLERAGHPVAFLYEKDEPADRRPIAPGDVPSWPVEDLSLLRAWEPDLVYVHGFQQTGWVGALVEEFPVVFFCHDYVGTCISGLKKFGFPAARPCAREFGSKCLLNYYPRRCGGWSPVTMLHDYRWQTKRLELLRKGRALLVASQAMRGEYLRHGFDATGLHLLPYDSPVAACQSTEWRSAPEWRVLFAGRIEKQKGADLLLEAVPLAEARLDRKVRVTFAGDGRSKSQLRERAARMGIAAEFPGWVDGPTMEALLAEADLLAVPSVWPEPFGLVGIEAGTRGVPAAAFRVGGIPEWLIDGVNGHLAPGDPPTARGLADAIVRCLKDPAEYRRLRAGAAEAAGRFSAREHFKGLLNVFGEVLSHTKVHATAS